MKIVNCKLTNFHNLENLYISPLELCNLNCLYCYTKKPKTILSNQQILDFIKNYQKTLNRFAPVKGRFGKAERGLFLKSIIFCGGEVFTLPNFPNLINKLLSQNIFITIITNGTIDKLDKIKQPQNCQLIVSFDGPKKIHDQNRGVDNFVKSKNFVKKALNLGFPVEIFYLITKDSYAYKDSFPISFSKALKHYSTNVLNFTYLTDRLSSLSRGQVSDIRTHYPCYPPKNFGCNIFSLQSNGKFYGCCESNISIGTLADPLEKVLKNYIDIITKYPKCSNLKHFCGLNN